MRREGEREGELEMPDFTAHLSQAPCPWRQGQGSSISLSTSAAYKCEALADSMEESLNIQSLHSELQIIINH